MEKQRNDVKTTEDNTDYWWYKSEAITLHRFYRPTLCVSAVFAVARCLSVRPSVCILCPVGALYPDGFEDIVKRLCRPGSPISLVFDPHRRYPIPRGATYKEVGKFCDFRLKSSPISEAVRDRSTVLWNFDRKSCALSNGDILMTLTNHNPVFKVTAVLKSNIS